MYVLTWAIFNGIVCPMKVTFDSLILKTSVQRKKYFEFPVYFLIKIELQDTKGFPRGCVYMITG